MASDIDSITIAYEENGQELVRELDKEILSRGAWTTILFKYRDWVRSKNEFGPAKFSIRRYRKLNDEYRQQSKFSISSADQATKLITALQRMMDE